MELRKVSYLVTGASGVIGLPLVKRLVEQGEQVRVLVHQTPVDLPEGVQIYRGDINDAAVLHEAVAGVQAVFHLAAKLHTNNPGVDLHAEYARVNVQGTRSLAEAAQKANVERFVFFSSINVYGHSEPGQILDENAPLNPDSWYAETKVQAEQIVSGLLPSVILRFAAVYGPRMKGNYLKMAHALKKRWFIPVGNGLNRRTLIYEEDAADAALLASHHSAASGRVFNVTDAQIYTLRQIIEAICAALQRPSPLFYLPAAPIRLSAAVLESALHRVGKKSPVGAVMIDKLIEDVAISGNRLRDELGFTAQNDLRRGWTRTLEGLAAHDHGS